MSDRYHGTLQENLVTLLAHDPVAGKTVANMLDTNLMDGEFRLLADRCIEYWRKYNEPPKDHTPDLVDDIINDKANKRAKGMRRILEAMITLAPSVNSKYVIDQIQTFGHMQRVKSAIIESAEKINANAQIAIPEIEEIWHGILQTQQKDFNPGTRMGSYKEVMDELAKASNEFTTGIKELDRTGVVPARGTVYMILAAAGRGKTWGAIQIGRRALEDRKKVLHITLEMSEALVMSRYYQTMLTIPKRRGLITNTHLVAELGELRRLDRIEFKPKFSLDVDNIDFELEVHLGKMGSRVNNLLVKRFPGRYLTPNILRTYMDMLEQTEGFTPDMVIVDYPRLMKQDAKDLRISLDNTLVDLRAIADERNQAFVCPHQASKEGEEAPQIKGTHLSEAWALAGTVDTLVAYSCSDLEFAFGLGRVFVAKARSEKDRFTTLITQNYGIGQFVIQSFPMRGEYADLLKNFAKEFRHMGDPTHTDADRDDEVEH